MPAYPRRALAEADCARLESLTPAPIDLRDEVVARVDRLLREVDPGSAHRIFSLAPEVFMFWLGGIGTFGMSSLGGALHETNHEIDIQLERCASRSGSRGWRFVFEGVIRPTGLVPGLTAPYGLAAAAVPDALKQGGRYLTYIAGRPGSTGEFDTLLEELNAYTTGASWEIRFLESKARPLPDGQCDCNLAGMLDFMVFTQAYLRAARTGHPASYAAIRDDPEVRTHIQRLWTRAEDLLLRARPFTSTVRDGDAARQYLPADYLEAAYSPGLLAELDALGISHRTRSDWVGIYLAASR